MHFWTQTHAVTNFKLKLNNVLWMLYFLRGICDTNLLTTLYFSLVQSIWAMGEGGGRFQIKNLKWLLKNIKKHYFKHYFTRGSSYETLFSFSSKTDKYLLYKTIWFYITFDMINKNATDTISFLKKLRDWLFRL